MSKRSTLYFSLLALLLLSVTLACSTVANFTDKTTISIVSPDPEVRIGEVKPEDGSPVSRELIVRMDTNTDRFIPATVYLNGVAKPDICNLEPNANTNCGALDFYNPGQQTVVVQVTKLGGEVITAETVILWEPYIGWDATALKLAQVAGSNDPTMGFFLFGVMFLVVFNILILAVFKSGQSVILGIFVSTIILIVLFIRNDPKVAADLFLALIALAGSSVIAGVFVYGMSKNYALGRKDNIYLNLPLPNGQQITLDKTSGALLGNGASSSDLTAEIIKAYMEASARSGAPINGITHFIDGKIVSDEQFKLMTGQNQILVAPRRGFIPWLFSVGKRNRQKLLK